MVYLKLIEFWVECKKEKKTKIIDNGKIFVSKKIGSKKIIDSKKFWFHEHFQQKKRCGKLSKTKTDQEVT